MPRPPFSSLDSPTDPYHKVNVDGSWKGSVAGEHNLEHVVIEDDSKLVMDAINDRGITGSWRIYPIVILFIGLRVCFVQSLGSGLRDLPIEQPMLVQL
ncbi:hypothetical protein ACFX13_004526 [Malus domestica]